MIVFEILFWFCGLIIFWAMIGYPVSLKLINKIIKPKPLPKDSEYKPTVTLMIVAHNEESVIKQKLEDVLKQTYPTDKLEILVSSDNSTDKTNDIVKNFINDHSERKIRLYEVKERKGKTNAQNEAAKTVQSELLVMTDANAMLKENAVEEIVSAFYEKDIAYVTGRLVYTNSEQFTTSNSENTYWDLDTSMREIESRLQTITAGNGALYACRTEEYYDFNPIKCHDSAMPIHYALNGKRAIANHDAIAYEKAGENIKDEFGRKVRMARIILDAIMPNIKILNIFKYKWFTFFYLGHRTARYLLWLAHILVLITNIILVIMNNSFLYTIILTGQILFYLIAMIKKVLPINNKICNMVYYYCMTIVAQIVGVKNILTGQAKPFWEKAESTR